MYEYNARVTKVVDGDTIDCDVDLGFYMTANIRFRLARINTPEVRGAEKVAGKAAKQWLIDLLNKHDNKIRVGTSKTGKYGRWIADIIIDDEIDTLIVNDELVKAGHAEYTDYD